MTQNQGSAERVIIPDNHMVVGWDGFQIARICIDTIFMRCCLEFREFFLSCAEIQFFDNNGSTASVSSGPR